MCMFPDVRMARTSKMTRSEAKAPSRIIWNVGCNDDPGVRMLLKNDSRPDSFSCPVLIVGAREVGRKAECHQFNRHQRMTHQIHTPCENRRPRWTPLDLLTHPIRDQTNH